MADFAIDEVSDASAWKFIAVAGGEGFVVETVQGAWAWVDKNHSGDAGAFVQYVPCVQGPRIYVWRTCDDGVARPVLRGVLFSAQGQPLTDWFLGSGVMPASIGSVGDGGVAGGCSPP